MAEPTDVVMEDPVGSDPESELEEEVDEVDYSDPDFKAAADEAVRRKAKIEARAARRPLRNQQLPGQASGQPEGAEVGADVPAPVTL